MADLVVLELENGFFIQYLWVIIPPANVILKAILNLYENVIKVFEEVLKVSMRLSWIEHPQFNDDLDLNKMVWILDKRKLVCRPTILIIFHNPYLFSLSVAHICCMSVWKPSPKRTARWVTEHGFEIPIHVLYAIRCITVSHLLMTDIQRIRSCPRIIFSGYQFAYMRIKHITGNIQYKWNDSLTTHSTDFSQSVVWTIQHSTLCVHISLYSKH